MKKLLIILLVLTSCSVTNKKSTGVWEGVWDVEGEIVAEIEVNLIY